MPKTVQDIYDLLRTKLPGWSLKPIPPLTDKEKEKTGIEAFKPTQASLLVSPGGESLVVAMAHTNMTAGAGRVKPQIRIFMSPIQSAFAYSIMNHMRFFALVVCKTSAADLDFPPNIVPDDYLVSLESNFGCSSGRVDLRSMYDNLLSNSSQDYFKLTRRDHSCNSIDQASFLRISDAANPVLVEPLLSYLTYFDSRPYMLSAKEGTAPVYQPSAMFEKAPVAESSFPWNLLVFGAPGTGKSFLLEKKLQQLKAELGEVVYQRITFHSDYTYQQFVGGYLPVPKPTVETVEFSGNGAAYEGKISGPHISYEFVPGPLASMLAKAYVSKIKGEETKYVLILEELNRANAASVFGDLFQLLDRDLGVSNYCADITDAFASYLFDSVCSAIPAATASLLTRESFQQIRLPENLYLWSTMNSADQGVFPLDSAFKRRWSFLYKDINAVAPQDANRPWLCLPDCSDPLDVRAVRYDWNTLRKGINQLILQTGFDEDRCVGYWFFSSEEIAAVETHTDCVVKAYGGDEDAAQELETLPDPFMDKLLAYLRQDVFRNIPAQFFQEDCKTLSAIRLAANHLELSGRKPVSLAGDVTVLTADAFVPV